MKEWWTRAEMIEAQLPSLTSKAAISRQAKLCDWDGKPDQCRTREGRGAPQEIHFSILPQAAKIAIGLKDASEAKVDIETKRTIAIEGFDRTLDGREQEERDARLAILAIIERYQATTGTSKTQAIKTIVAAYNARTLQIEGYIVDAIPSISRSRVYHWFSAKRDQKLERLGGSKTKNRSKTGLLEVANQGAVKSYVLGLIAKQPQLTASPIRDAIAQRFSDQLELIDSVTGEITYCALPPLRTLQRDLKRWKEQHKNELIRLTNPDRYKSQIRLAAVGGASVNIHRLNQLWEIDASPADVMTTEGRWNIYACIDVWSRRTRILVTQTPRAAAVGLLVRDAIKAWGVPEQIKTDNGSDFIAKQTKRLLSALGIEQLICDPFSPEQKPHVERVIKTYQHGLAITAPGYIGASVADRSIIENRKKFSARLGTSKQEIFEVDLSAQELQEASTTWAEKVYGNNPHSSLNGLTPNERAATYNGQVSTLDEHALSVLLAPIASGDGIRTVMKSGIRVNNEYYHIGSVPVGQTVFCRNDPADLGTIWVYSEDGETFLDHAYAPVLAGMDPVETITRARAMQKAIEDDAIKVMRREMRNIGPRDVMNAVLNKHHKETVVAFPKKRVEHTTPALKAAAETYAEIKPEELPTELGDMMADIRRELGGTEGNPTPATAAPTPVEPVIKQLKKQTQFDRYSRARQLEKRAANNEPITHDDATWLSGYRNSDEYESCKEMEQDFGMASLKP